MDNEVRISMEQVSLEMRAPQEGNESPRRQRSRKYGDHSSHDDITADPNHGTATSQPSFADADQVRVFGVSLPALWKRLKWGLLLTAAGNDAFAFVRREELKAAIAATLEVVIMGSALVLTLCLQVQEVVGSRGGFAGGNGNSVALHIFVVASSLSFSFSFYSIVTSSAMLLTLSACPSE